MDTWYATKAVMLHIEHLQKTFLLKRIASWTIREVPIPFNGLIPLDKTRTGHRKTETRGFPENHKVPGCISGDAPIFLDFKQTRRWHKRCAKGGAAWLSQGLARCPWPVLMTQAPSERMDQAMNGRTIQETS